MQEKNKINAVQSSIEIVIEKNNNMKVMNKLIWEGNAMKCHEKIKQKCYINNK